VGDFPIQASQKDALGRMCRVHWNEYTTALRKAALARKVAAEEPTIAATEPELATPAGKPLARRRRKAKSVAAVAPGAARRIVRPTEANTRALGASPGPFCCA
jgi:hypothetical protein